MKIISIKYILFAVVLCIAASCKKSFEELNTDPNRPKTITPGVMLGQLQYRLINANVRAARGFTHELMQVDAPRESTSGGGVHRYDIQPGATGWSAYYEVMTDIEDIYRIAEELDEDNYKAIALVYKSWVYSILTDLYGDVPYSEAIHALEGNVRPAFDHQKDIYTSLLANLDTANTLFNTGKALTYGGDMVYNANALSGGVNEGIVKWKKFCNSLRLRMLLRISAREGEIDVNNRITAILADPATYPVFTGNGDDAIFRYPGTFPYFNPYYNARQLDWRDGTYVTKFFIGKMNEIKDPRRAVWFRTVPVDGNLVYQGIESGYPASFPIYLVGKNSNYSDGLKTSPLIGIMMTYAEVEFIKAELALKGFATGNTPKAHYENGIKASMTQWNVPIAGDFLTQPGVAFDESGSIEAQLEQIMLQKYYALFFIDYQSWFEKRRTGYPVLPRGAGIPAENQFPNRTPYPTYLQSLNADNLAAAISSMGGDGSDIKVWWQK